MLSISILLRVIHIIILLFKCGHYILDLQICMHQWPSDEWVTGRGSWGERFLMQTSAKIPKCTENLTYGGPILHPANANDHNMIYSN